MIISVKTVFGLNFEGPVASDIEAENRQSKQGAEIGLYLLGPEQL